MQVFLITGFSKIINALRASCLPRPTSTSKGTDMRKGVFHFVFDDGSDDFDFVFVGVKNQFVMHLQEHFRFEVFFFKSLVNVDHRQFDNVCCRTLYGRIHSISFGTTSHHCVLRVDVFKVATSL